MGENVELFLAAFYSLELMSLKLTICSISSWSCLCFWNLICRLYIHSTLSSYLPPLLHLKITSFNHPNRRLLINMRYSILSALVLGAVGVFADQPYPSASHTVTASYYTVPSNSSMVTAKYTGPPAQSTYVPTSYKTDCGEYCGGTCGDGVVQSPYEEGDLGPKLNVSFSW